MILFVGQIERGMREREAFQELDRAAFGSIAKWVTEVDDPARFPSWCRGPSMWRRAAVRVRW